MAFGKDISTWFEGRWHSGDARVLRGSDHGVWMGTLVFDGARMFEDCVPDLDLHCARIVRSAEAMGMIAPMEGPQIAALIRERLSYYRGRAVYIRPMMWSCEGNPGLIALRPESTALAIAIEDTDMPDPDAPYALTHSPYCRPRRDMAVCDAKAACLYANNGRIHTDALRRGFDNALSLDADGLIAETASSNVFFVEDGHVRTPKPNGMFLAGLTRARIIALLRADGVEVEECPLTYADVANCDEIFLTANAAKVISVTRYLERDLPSNAMAKRARRLYWDYARSQPAFA